MQVELQRIDDLPGDQDALDSFKYWLVPVFMAGCICMPLSFMTRSQVLHGLTWKLPSQARLERSMLTKAGLLTTEDERRLAGSETGWLAGLLCETVQ